MSSRQRRALLMQMEKEEGKKANDGKQSLSSSTAKGDDDYVLVNKVNIIDNSHSIKKNAFQNLVGDSDSDEDEEENVAKAKSKKSNSDSDDNNNDDDNDGHDGKEKREQSKGKEIKSEIPQPSKSKSKKKKSKKKQNAKVEHMQKESNASSNDEWEMITKELANDLKNTQIESSTTKETKQTNTLQDLLKCDINHLNPAREIIRHFGKDALSSSQSHGSSSSHRAGRGRRLNKKLYLVTPDDNWAPPPTFLDQDGVRMVKINTVGDINVYSFEASDSYKKTQKEFIKCQASHNPDTIFHLIRDHPFHVDSLLQVSEVYLHSAQYEQAELFLRRALFTMESWFHPTFQSAMASGTVKLQISEKSTSDDFDASLNRSLLKAMSKSMLFSGRRGLFQTAFSLNKVIYLLGGDSDPMHAMLSIDYYALRAGKPSFVIDLVSRLKSVADSTSTTIAKEADSTSISAAASTTSNTASGLYQFPNFYFSHAIALRIQGKEQEADAKLDEALTHYPGSVEILSQSSKALDTTNNFNWKLSLEWGSRAARALFVGANEEQIKKQYEKILKLALMRQTSLWTEGGDVNNEATSLLCWVARRGAYLNKSNIVPKQLSIDSKLIDHYSQAQFSDFTDNVALISPADHMLELAAGRMNEQRNARAAPARPNVNLDQNLLALFFNTMMPWAVLPNENETNQQNQGEEEEDDDQEE